ncbi:SRPBCC family protein [Glycomyces sp. TRM65418]|uniref:SRPBCC family protein n=1 Tax=Glycomyces sp. TRM65418 TaxID=2867006 RepID=UPI001CE661E5|nr:SRPBCC family protein [Glycomyces sp. TRM65418]MCC3764794.1 SRPBCC family protein [Glycomyces sp. TRM65418]QZD54447.1 SRPBCC family protein [Glycomyces sp. TRM65418]
MTDPKDPIASAGLVTREIRTGERDGTATKVLVARRSYRAARTDVWDALTNPERLPRWFLPVSGDLSEGGRYQFEGNAGGVVERCDAPESFAATWEFGGQVSWIEVRLGDEGERTVLELVHEAFVDPELWRQFGPGAVGVGWDGGLHGLGDYLETGEPLDSAEWEAWMTGPEGVEYARMTAEAWGRAAVADGDDPDEAQAAVEAVIAFYTTPPEQAPEA